MRESEKARTKAARKAAANECSELILRLWEKRSAWPQGWPPPSAASVLERLADLDPSRSWGYQEDTEDEDARSWLATFPLIQQLQSSEIDIWRQAALAEIDVEDAREWLKKHGKQMEEEERETLKDIVQMADSSRQWAERFVSRGRKKVTKQFDVGAQLRELSSKRAKLVKQATSGPKPVKITSKPRDKSGTRRRRTTSG
jgi:hypothetical protein